VTPGTTRSVFLSYRREDTRHLAGRLADRLADRLGSTQVFMDVTAIEPGADFAAAIAREVAACDVLIALIGPTWSAIADQRGRRRLDDPDDIVVLEIQAALEREIRVIPVLVDGAVMPDREDLPYGVQDLARRNAVRVDHETFHSDITTLLDVVERSLPTPQKAAGPTVRTDAGATDRAIDTEHVEQALDADHARAVYQRAIDSGHTDLTPAGAVNLGLLLAMQGDVDGAQTAYRRAITSGHAEWAPAALVSLGLLFAERGNDHSARAAFRQAINSGHVKWAKAADDGLSMLWDRQYGHALISPCSHLTILTPAAAVSLGLLLAEQGDGDDARIIYQRVIDSGYTHRPFDCLSYAARDLRRLKQFIYQPWWRRLLE
jgi:TIR domain/Tetratricopeptide repeat